MENDASYEITIRVFDYINKKKYRKTIEVNGNFITVGRGKNTNLPLNDSKVSTLHCKLTFKDNAIILTDEESSNGTYLNDKKIKKATLPLEERVKVGQHKFMVESLKNLKEGTTFEEDDFEEIEEDDEDYDDHRDDSADGIVAFVMGVITGFIANPFEYLDKKKYSTIENNTAVSIIALTTLISSIEMIISNPLLGAVMVAFPLLSLLGYAFICELTKNFTDIKATKFQVLHFLTVYCILGLPIAMIGYLPLIGAFSMLFFLILFILGIKGFFRAFKPKVFQMIVVTIAYGWLCGIIYAPIAALLIPKPSPEEIQKSQADTQKKMLGIMEKFIKSQQKN